MNQMKIALIGNSGAGKTAAMMLLSSNPTAADMDKHFDPRVCPTHEEGLAWILDRTPGEDVATVSCHIGMLEQMRDAKRGGADRDRFAKVLFVYLYNPNTLMQKERLEAPNAWGELRGWDHVGACLVNDAKVHAVCKELADVAIHTDGLTVEDVAGQIAALRDAVIRQGRP